MWQEHDVVFYREDGTLLDRRHVRKEFWKITKNARLGGTWTPASPPHSFVSILSAHDVRIENIMRPGGAQQHIGHRDRHEIRPAFTKDATAMNRILKASTAKPA